MQEHIMDILKDATLRYFSKNNAFDAIWLKDVLYRYTYFGTRYEIKFYENKIEYHFYGGTRCDIITVYKNGDIHSRIQMVYGSFSF